eukprot:6088657-Ditylum_brightwellii.AAC.1
MHKVGKDDACDSTMNAVSSCRASFHHEVHNRTHLMLVMMNESTLYYYVASVLIKVVVQYWNESAQLFFS